MFVKEEDIKDDRVWQEDFVDPEVQDGQEGQEIEERNEKD
jgi:hypothetical protein